MDYNESKDEMNMLLESLLDKVIAEDQEISDFKYIEKLGKLVEEVSLVEASLNGFRLLGFFMAGILSSFLFCKMDLVA